VIENERDDVVSDVMPGALTCAVQCRLFAAMLFADDGDLRLNAVHQLTRASSIKLSSSSMSHHSLQPTHWSLTSRQSQYMVSRSTQLHNKFNLDRHIGVYRSLAAVRREELMND